MPTLPSFSLAGQTALVTGAGRGLGRAIALGLAEAGADVALGLRDIGSHGGLVEEVEALGRRALPLQMDVTNLPQVASAVEAASAHFGRLDILVNNAGFAMEAAAEDVTEEQWDAQLSLNVKGLFFAAQAAGRIMLKQGSGAIVNLSSQAGFVALPGVSVYCLTKAAIAHLTKCLAVEWGPRGVRVNAVAPTFFDTPSTQGPLADETFRADVIERIAALHRIGQPMEAAAAVVFLASPAAAMITGHTLLVDGGWTAR